MPATLRDVSVAGAGTTWVARATCGACGAPAELSFTARTDPATVTAPPDELARGPSLQIRAEAFRAELARVLPRVDSDPAARARARLCVAELAKLTHAGPELDVLTSQLAVLRGEGR